MPDKTELSLFATNAVANVEYVGVTLPSSVKTMLVFIEKSESLPEIQVVFDNLMLIVTTEYFLRYIDVILTYLGVDVTNKCVSQISEVFEGIESSDWEAIWNDTEQVLAKENIVIQLFNLALKSEIAPKDFPFVNSLVRPDYQIDPETYEGLVAIRHLPPQTQIDLVTAMLAVNSLRQSAGEIRTFLEEAEDLDPTARGLLDELAALLDEPFSASAE